MTASFFPHKVALPALEQALLDSDIEQVRLYAPFVNWIRVYESHLGAAVISENSLLEQLENMKPTKAQREFTQQALVCLVEAGFRALDDSHIMEVYTQDNHMTRVLAQLSVSHGLRDDTGGTMLHMCLQTGIPFHSSVKHALVEGLDCNTQDFTGDTAFHNLWKNDMWDVEYRKEWNKTMVMLLDHGADPHIKNEDGISGFQAMRTTMERMDAQSVKQTTQAYGEALARLEARTLEATTPHALGANARRGL